MKVHPVVVQANGIITVTMQASFVGDPTDTTDQQRIAAFGDPKVNLAGLFTDPNNTQFTFVFPASELYVGITTQMQNFSARFFAALPTQPLPNTPFNPYGSTASWNPFASQNGLNTPLFQQGDLDCLTTDPAHAASVWAAAIDSRVQSAMTALRALSAPITSLPDSTV